MCRASFDAVSDGIGREWKMLEKAIIPYNRHAGLYPPGSTVNLPRARVATSTRKIVVGSAIRSAIAPSAALACGREIPRHADENCTPFCNGPPYRYDLIAPRAAGLDDLMPYRRNTMALPTVR